MAGAGTLAEANRVLEEFLPSFNECFGVPAAHPEPAYRPVDPRLDVDGVLCIKERRRVAKDNTVQYQGYPDASGQLFPGTDRPSYARARVEVQERLDGRLLVSYRGKLLTPEDAPPLASALRASATSPVVPAQASPPEDECPGTLVPSHPRAFWRESLFGTKMPGRSVSIGTWVRAGISAGHAKMIRVDAQFVGERRSQGESAAGG